VLPAVHTGNGEAGLPRCSAESSHG
jgi:hypothetical protein